MLDEVSDSAVRRRRGAKEHTGHLLCLFNNCAILHTIVLAVCMMNVLAGKLLLPLLPSAKPKFAVGCKVQCRDM